MIQKVSSLPPIWSNVLGLDLETTTRTVKSKGKSVTISDPFQDRILSLAISDGKNSWYLTENFESVLPLLLDEEKIFVIHNAAFDLKFLIRYLGVDIKAQVWDTLIVERLLHTGDSSYRHGLSDVLARRFGVVLNKETRKTFSEHTGDFTPEQINYIEQDVLHLPRLYYEQLKDIGGRLINPLEEKDFKPGLGVIAWLELSVIPVVVSMELYGVNFDVELFESHRRQIEEYLKQTEGKFIEYLKDFWHEVVKTEYETYTVVGARGKELTKKRKVFKQVRERKYVSENEDGTFSLTINLGSWQQVLSALNDLGIPATATGEPYLREHFEDESFVEDYLEYKRWLTLLKFPYSEHINPVTGRIHPSWNQLATEKLDGTDKDGTKTGRFACGDPNLQQVPKKVKESSAPDMRACFSAPRGRKLVIADYSQQEPRGLAQVSGDPKLIKAANETDIYSALGEPVYGHRVEKGSSERDNLKVSVLAHFYGGGGKTLARALDVSVDEAWKVKNRLDRAFPKAKYWGDRQLKSLLQKGYIETLWGRRRYVPEIKKAKPEVYWKFDHICRNTPIQGSSADVGKLAMVLIHNEFKKRNLDAKIIMVVHDEIVVEGAEEIIEEVLEVVEWGMLDAMKRVFPDVLPGVEAGIRDYWQKV